MRHLRKIARRIDIALERRRRLDVMLDSIEAGGECGSEREIRIRIRTCSAAFNAQRLPVADDAKTCGAIVVAPRDACRRERARDVALVGRWIRRIKREHLAD